MGQGGLVLRVARARTGTYEMIEVNAARDGVDFGVISPLRLERGCALR
jgi:hypothetical protein